MESKYDRLIRKYEIFIKWIYNSSFPIIVLFSHEARQKAQITSFIVWQDIKKGLFGITFIVRNSIEPSFELVQNSMLTKPC